MSARSNIHVVSSGSLCYFLAVGWRALVAGHLRGSTTTLIQEKHNGWTLTSILKLHQLDCLNLHLTSHQKSAPIQRRIRSQ